MYGQADARRDSRPARGARARARRRDRRPGRPTTRGRSSTGSASARADGFDGLLLNAGAYTHTSIAIYDALQVPSRCPASRSTFRTPTRARRSGGARGSRAACVGRVAGFGAEATSSRSTGLVRLAACALLDGHDARSTPCLTRAYAPRRRFPHNSANGGPMHRVPPAHERRPREAATRSSTSSPRRTSRSSSTKKTASAYGSSRGARTVAAVAAVDASPARCRRRAARRTPPPARGRRPRRLRRRNEPVRRAASTARPRPTRPRSSRSARSCAPGRRSASSKR